MSGRGNLTDLDRAEALVREHPGRTAGQLAWLLLGGQLDESGRLVGKIEAGPARWEKSKSLHKRLRDLQKRVPARVIKRGELYYAAGVPVRAERQARRAPAVVDQASGRRGLAGLKQALGE